MANKYLDALVDCLDEMSEDENETSDTRGDKDDGEPDMSGTTDNGGAEVELCSIEVQYDGLRSAHR